MPLAALGGLGPGSKEEENDSELGGGGCTLDEGGGCTLDEDVCTLDEGGGGGGCTLDEDVCT